MDKGFKLKATEDGSSQQSRRRCRDPGCPANGGSAVGILVDSSVTGDGEGIQCRLPPCGPSCPAIAGRAKCRASDPAGLVPDWAGLARFSGE